MISTYNQPKVNVLKASGVLLTAMLLLAFSSLQAQSYDVNKVRKDFIALLQRPAVIANSTFQSFVTDSVLIEKGFFFSESTEKVPVLIYKPVMSKFKKSPVVICLHGTGGSKDAGDIKKLLYRV